MSNPKGSLFERQALEYLRSRNFDTERLRLAGREDEGDLLIRLGEDRFVLEAKNVKAMDLAGWVREAEAEAENYRTHRGLSVARVFNAVLHKRKGKGIAQSYITLTFDEYLETIIR